jgi:hypothetical protein
MPADNVDGAATGAGFVARLAVPLGSTAAVRLGVRFLVRVRDPNGQLRDLQARAVIDAS